GTCCRRASGSGGPRSRARPRSSRPSSASWSRCRTMGTPSGMLTREELKGLVVDGQVDTVLLAFPDQQGRLVGKRLTGDFFLHDILEGEGVVHGCNYLLAVDMEMEPLPGYAYASWDT